VLCRGVERREPVTLRGVDISAGGEGHVDVARRLREVAATG